MVFGYIRFSTCAQDQTQQKFALDEYAKQRGLTIDEFVMDEGISGGVSYKNRKLYGLVKKMSAGDTLIVTEISRLGRSMGDLNMLVTQELKPRRLRLIIIKMGLDLDCANLKAVDEMIIFAFSFSAQCEKEMIVQRTQSAIDARKEMLKKDGCFVSKTGRLCTRLGNRKGDPQPEAVIAMAEKRTEIANGWKMESGLYSWVSIQLLKGRSHKDILEEAQALYEKNPEKYRSRRGGALSAATLSRWAGEILRKN